LMDPDVGNHVSHHNVKTSASVGNK